MNIMSQEWSLTLVMSHVLWKAGYSIPACCGFLAFVQRSGSNPPVRGGICELEGQGAPWTTSEPMLLDSLTPLATSLEDVRVDTQANSPVHKGECLLPLNLTCEIQGFILPLNCLYLAWIFQCLCNPWRNVVLKYFDPCSLRAVPLLRVAELFIALIFF